MQGVKDDSDGQVERIKIILNFKQSKLKPYIALFGVKNYILLKNQNLLGNNPSIKWYLTQLQRARITNNYWGVRAHLKKLALYGLFIEKINPRVVDNSYAGHHRITQVPVNEFYLSEKLFGPLSHALKEIFKTDSLSSLWCNNFNSE